MAVMIHNDLVEFVTHSSTSYVTSGGKRVVFLANCAQLQIAMINCLCNRKDTFNVNTIDMVLRVDSLYVYPQVFIGVSDHDLTQVSDILREPNVFLWEVTKGSVFFNGVKQTVDDISTCHHGNMFELTIDMENKKFICHVVGDHRAISLPVPDLPNKLSFVVACYTSVEVSCEMRNFRQSKPSLPSIISQACFDVNSMYGPLDLPLGNRTVYRPDVTSNCYILLNQIIREGKYCMELKVKKDTGASLCIGFAPPSFTLPRTVMYDRTHPIYVIKGLTLWRSYRGLVYINGVEQKLAFPLQEYKDDRFPITIELYVDCASGKAALYKNKQFVGIIFENVCPPVQPIIAFYAGYEKEVELIDFSHSVIHKPIKANRQEPEDAIFIHQQGNITITNEGKTVERMEEEFGNSFATLNVKCTSGIYKFTFCIEQDDGASTIIGIAGEQLGTIKRDSKVYLERWACAYRSYQGQIYIYGRQQQKRFEQFWESGTLIQMEINMDKRVVEFTVNEQSQGVAFTGIPKPTIPFVGFYADHAKSLSLLHYAHTDTSSTEIGVKPIQQEMNDFSITEKKSSTPHSSMLNADTGGMLILKECLVCERPNRNVVYMPCMHGVHCPDDATIFQKCPLCDQEVTGMYNVF